MFQELWSKIRSIFKPKKAFVETEDPFDPIAEAFDRAFENDDQRMADETDEEYWNERKKPIIVVQEGGTVKPYKESTLYKVLVSEGWSAPGEDPPVRGGP